MLFVLRFLHSLRVVLCFFSTDDITTTTWTNNNITQFLISLLISLHETYPKRLSEAVAVFSTSTSASLLDTHRQPSSIRTYSKPQGPFPLHSPQADMRQFTFVVLLVLVACVGMSLFTMPMYKLRKVEGGRQTMVLDSAVTEFNVLNNLEEIGEVASVVQEAVNSATGVLEEIGEVASVVQEAVNSATGVLFSGKPFRSFTEERHFQPGWKANEEVIKPNIDIDKTCSNWAVVTTISGPTEAVKLAAELPGWCTVVVADRKTPNNYVELAGLRESAAPMHFLSVADQEKWATTHSGKIGRFVRSIPYNHFARKNIGYIYAIQHGAKFVFDFDDDNILHKDSSGNTLDPIANKTHLEHVRVPLLGKNVLNHHELMNASIPGSWPRGFPLDQYLDLETRGSVAYEKEAVPMDQIGVMQFCAQGDPDVDAIHRLIKPLPMNFATDDKAMPLQVPTHAFVPYNAQASIHTYQALWATLLPYTVPGRVSDIWRGYFAEAIFRDLDISVAFLPPKVTQVRNPHSYLADMQAELDLYFKATTLVEFLSGWSSIAETVPERMEELWIQLYERGYIEADDVKLVQLWLDALVESQYDFPRIVRRRFDNVILMGQFNYANDADSVVFWVQKWREWFGHVVVRGPFNETEISVLHSRGIKAYTGVNDKGHYSPVENLMLTLDEHKETEDIDGVLYLHDDAFLDVQKLTQGRYPFPSEDIIGSTLSDFFPLSYLDHRRVEDKELLSRFSYNIHPDGNWSKADGTKFDSQWQLKKSLKKWPFFQRCIGSLTKASKDSRMEVYKQKDDTFLVPSPTQADMLYIPTALANDFAKAARIMLDSNVFLECAYPTIAQMLQISSNATIRTVSLCTNWRKSRGKETMVSDCLADHANEYGMYHPFKLSKGFESWGRTFDTIARKVPFSIMDS
jgi:hypothetical protein